MENKYYHSGYVKILGRKHNNTENLLNIECSIFDMSGYVDAVRACLRDNDIDYLIVEPIKISGDLFEQF